MLHRHIECGHEWYVVPGNLKQGSGCPNCHDRPGVSTAKSLSRNPDWALSNCENYIIRWPDDEDAHKVGLTKVWYHRMHKHGSPEEVRRLTGIHRAGARWVEITVLRLTGNVPNHPRGIEILADPEVGIRYFDLIAKRTPEHINRQGIRHLILEGDPEWASYWTDYLKERP